jgi:2-oxoisovalerate dehydrogenase E2 component (dihydrolipoyl transacylase)
LLGNIGGKVLSPVILPPQVCIIGISKMFDSISVVGRNEKDDEYRDHHVFHHLEDKNLTILFHKSLNMCISADHRILDGATIARFSELLKKYIENPLKIWIGN